MNNPNGQRPNAKKEITKGAEVGKMDMEIAAAVSAYNQDPTPANGQAIEALIARIEEQPQAAAWQPTAVELAAMQPHDLAGQLKALLRDTLQLDRGTNRFPIPEGEREERTWLIKDWLPAGTIGMLSGAGAAGKSLLALQLAMNLAAGRRDWIGRNGVKECLPLDAAAPFRVVYAPYEDELNIEIADRMDQINKQAGGDLYGQMGDRLHIEPMDDPIWSPPVGSTRWQPAKLTTAGKRLRALCEQHRADLLILDPLAEAAVLDEIDNAAIGDFIRSWRVWARTEPKCAVMLLHHLSKSEALKKVTDDDISGYRGGSAWQAGIRWLWMLKADTNQSTADRTVAQLRPLKSSYALTPDETTLYREKATQWTWQADNAQGNDAGERAGYSTKENKYDGSV